MRRSFWFLVLFFVGCGDIAFRPTADNSVDAGVTQTDSSVDIAQSVDVSAPQGTDAASIDTDTMNVDAGSKPDVDVQIGPYNWCNDKDGDFYSVCDGTCVIPGNESCGDCNDNDSNVHPGIVETCGNNVDDNCDGVTDWTPDPLSGNSDWNYITVVKDVDGDFYSDRSVGPGKICPGKIPSGWILSKDDLGWGWGSEGNDCNDKDPSIHPGAKELCDNIDNNCDGTTDNNPENMFCQMVGKCLVAHKDLIGNACIAKGVCAKSNSGVIECKADSSMTVICSTEMGGTNSLASAEVCGDNLDNDCNGQTDEGCNKCDAATCKSIDGYCWNDGTCHQWCESACDLTIENCVDTNGNGYGDKCVPKDLVPQGAISPKGVCVGSVLFVPYNCATIQSAINAQPENLKCNPSVAGNATSNISVAAGTYNESLLVTKGRYPLIQNIGTGKVVIDGGLEHAVEVQDCSALELYGLTIQNAQSAENSTWPATIFTNLGASIEIYSSTINTHSTGIMTGYSWFTYVEDCTINGLGTDKIAALDLEYESDSRVFNTKFVNVTTAIYKCSDNASLKLSETSGDSNTYVNVINKLVGNGFNCGTMFP